MVIFWGYSASREHCQLQRQIFKAGLEQPECIHTTQVTFQTLHLNRVMMRLLPPWIWTQRIYYLYQPHTLVQDMVYENIIIILTAMQLTQFNNSKNSTDQFKSTTFIWPIPSTCWRCWTATTVFWWTTRFASDIWCQWNCIVNRNNSRTRNNSLDVVESIAKGF